MSDFILGFDKRKIDKTSLGLGIFVFLMSLVVYLMTVQKTVSFWDCGEFVACCTILGIPHPFGSPLFVLIGRLFTLLPLAADIGYRINVIASISEALAAMFGFFIIVRLVREWFGDQLDSLRKTGMYAGALIGALFMAFAYSNWNSAIEAEVYGIAMLMMNMIIWLTLIWSERQNEPIGNKLLILIVFLSVLSMAEHMTTYMIMPFIYIAIMLLSEKLRKDWTFWITGIVMLSVIISIPLFMIFLAIWFVICVLVYATTRSSAWVLPLALVTCAVVGYSIQFTTMVRADERPAINENAPASFGQFMDYLERKQYGQGSMIARMFTRRGTWANQFGTHDRMGFWGFFQRQYGINGTAFTFTLFPLGLMGLFELIYRRWQKGIPFFLTVFAATVGMVLYMNFADGTMAGKFLNDEAYLEVRDRDYFWQPGFILFGLSIGVGFVALWDVIYSKLKLRGEQTGKITYGMLIFVLMPLIAMKSNWYENDRSKNFISYDYAYNLLMSADSNAVVFTNGDNDTFPVWALQEAYGIRKDVRIANLSLLNTEWYIKQLKNEMGVPISLSDAQIDALRATRMQDGRVIRIQDIMIDNIIHNSYKGGKWTVPVEFAVTVSDDNRIFEGKPIDDHLQMKGMMYRVVSETGKDMIDLDGTVDLYQNIFKFRSVADSNVFKDENAARLTNNYAAGFLVTAEALRKKHDYPRAISMTQQSISVVPSQWQSYGYLMQIYADMDSLSRAEEILRNVPASVDAKPLRMSLANEYWSKNKDKKRGYQLLNEILDKDPEYKSAYTQLLAYYYQDKQYDSLESTLTRWVATHPNDTDTQGALAEVRKLRASDTSQTRVRLKQVEVPRDTH